MYYKFGKTDGVIRKFTSSGTLTLYQEYKDGLLNGKSKTYYESNPGKIKQEDNYINNLKDGLSVWFTPTGDTIAKYKYVNGKLEGVQRSFFAGNKIMLEENYVNNIQSGSYVEYFENGKVKTTGNYIDGKMNGNWQEFDETGNKTQEGIYVNDVKQGKWVEYNAAGKISATHKFVDGVEK